MARRVALIPEELFSSHQYKDPELRLEDEIASLLDRKKIPDDMKAKLLSQLVMRYQKTFHTPPDPIPVSVQNNQISENEEKQKQTDGSSVENENIDSYAKQDVIMKNILISTPYRYKKYVPMIVEKLKTRNYFWNSEGEMTEGNKTVKGSNIIDCFAYVFRNMKNPAEPQKFDFFLKALSEINIPRAWIANKFVLAKLQKQNGEDVFLPEATSTPYNKRDGDASSIMKGETVLGKRSRDLKSYSFSPSSSDSKKWIRSRSHSPKKKWLEY